MNCKHCGKPVVLVPSANERAMKLGGTAESYARLFEYHADCLLELRTTSTAELMKRYAKTPNPQ